MKFKDSIKTLGTASVYFFAIIFIIAVIVGGIRTCNKPIESLSGRDNVNKEVDSLTSANKIIIIEVNELDSIKNVEILKAQNLDNDSTLKLFYQLISE